MAKPIPYNRRWLQNQQAQQASQESQERGEPNLTEEEGFFLFAEGERAQRLFELLRVASERMIPQPQPSDDGAFDPAALVCEYLVPQEVDAFAVIHARYDTQCVGCGQPIRRGDPITRHPRWNVWVHAGCRDRQQRALVRSTIPARYCTTCGFCRQPINQGDRITRYLPYGWIHEACAQQLESISQNI
jgi:hypothetical protein